MNNDYTDEEYEYLQRYNERREEQRIQRYRKHRAKQIRRIIVVIGALLISVALIVLLLIVSIKAIVHAISDEDKDIVNVSIEQIEEPTELPADITQQEQTDTLAQSLSRDKDDLVDVHGTMLFGGYQADKTDDTYLITSENMMSQYAILIDAANGTIVCQKDGYAKINPASMTKIMTVLVAAEHLTEDDLDKKVTITYEDTDYAYVNDLSAVNFAADESVTVRDLFYGTILPSGADAAYALAKYVAGSEEEFVGLMNDKLQELGLSDTSHFTNCVGLYDENHYSTCYDITMMLKAAIENDFCYEVLNAHTYTTSLTTQHEEGITISNWFLRRIEDKETNGEVLCAKTGYVVESANCGASYEVTSSNHPYLCVTAGAHSAWRCIYDHVDLYANNTQ